MSEVLEGSSAVGGAFFFERRSLSHGEERGILVGDEDRLVAICEGGCCNSLLAFVLIPPAYIKIALTLQQGDKANESLLEKGHSPRSPGFCNAESDF